MIFDDIMIDKSKAGLQKERKEDEIVEKKKSVERTRETSRKKNRTTESKDKTRQIKQ